MNLLGFVFQEAGYGLFRYRSLSRAVAGGMNVLSDGAAEGMGVHVQISGAGCRLIEAARGFSSWREWIGTWLDRKARVARIDLAFDDESGAIAFETVHQQVKTRTAVMRAAHTELRETTNRKGVFRTLYVGKRASETIMRCYDKGMEQGEGRSWLRFEFEYKGARADAVARLLVNEGWDAAAGVARSFIEFKDENHATTDRTRKRAAPWWVELIDASKHVLRISRECHASLVRAWGWLERQAAPIIATITEYEGGDISWLIHFVREGIPRQNERHRRMLLSDGPLLACRVG